jgi:hypothetical protein
MILAPIFRPKNSEILGMIHPMGPLTFLALEKKRCPYPHRIPKDQLIYARDN